MKTAAVLVLTVVFMWSGMVKLLDPEAFALAVYRYHILPGFAVNPVAIWLPVLELTVAVCLWIPGMRAAALWVCAGLLLLFSGAIVNNVLTGNEVSCGCLSSSPLAGTSSLLSLLRNAGLLLLCGLALRNAHGTKLTV